MLSSRPRLAPTLLPSFSDRDPRLSTGLPGSPIKMNFETPTAVDDVVLKTDVGEIYVQAKRTITLSAKADSELASVAYQFVRQFRAGVIENGVRRDLITIGLARFESVTWLARLLGSVQTLEVLEAVTASLPPVACGQPPCMARPVPTGRNAVARVGKRPLRSAGRLTAPASNRYASISPSASWPSLTCVSRLSSS